MGKAAEDRWDWRTSVHKWTRDVHGYAICPRCGAMVHPRMVDIHGDVCGTTKESHDLPGVADTEENG